LNQSPTGLAKKTPVNFGKAGAFVVGLQQVDTVSHHEGSEL